MSRLEGKRVLVTGAAGGMGRSHCERLAEEGASVIALDVEQAQSGWRKPLRRCVIEAVSR